MLSTTDSDARDTADRAAEPIVPHVVVDRVPVLPIGSNGQDVSFEIRLPISELRLVSGAGIPFEVNGSSDVRRLGVALGRMNWRQGNREIEIAVSSPSFIDGFHVMEDNAVRWTNGDATFPLGAIPAWHGEAYLTLTLHEWEGSRRARPVRREAAVMAAFDSLGDDCELALAQLHFGVELPLSLLRWSGTDPRRLMAGLRNRFNGIGEPDSTELFYNGNEYRLKTPYLTTHTFRGETRDGDTEAEIVRSARATLRLMRRKLLDDIARGRRIYVFKTSDPGFGPAEMRELHAAVRRIGPADLLCVGIAEPGQRSGDVRKIGDGLYSGAVDRFVLHDGPYDTWFQICARTLALRDAS